MTQQEFRKRYEFDLKTDNIGGGSFGTVYKAYDTVLDREVAIKVSEVKIVGDKEFSLLEEYKAIENLTAHKNIANYEKVYRFESFPTVFDYGIMQFYALGNLSHYLKNNDVSIEKRQNISKGILEGIAFLHQHKVVHRDLKPSNVLVVDRRGEIIPKITDFGLSKQAEGDGKASRFTNSFAGGTLQYSSPEQLKGLPLKLNTDLWSFGAIAYEILTGKTLFEADSHSTVSAEWQNTITQKILHADINEELQTLPTNWQKVVRHCLERDVHKRAQDTTILFSILNGDENAASSSIDKEVIVQKSAAANNDATIIKGKAPQKKEIVKPKIPVQKTVTNPKKEKEQPNWMLPAIGASVVLLLGTIGYFMFSSEDAKPVERTLEVFKEGNLYGYKEGDKIVIAPNYIEAQAFVNDSAKVAVADSSFYINKKGIWFATITDSIIYRKELANKVENDFLVADKNAWELAKKVNTKDAYESYLKDYKNGDYKSNAVSAIGKLKVESNSIKIPTKLLSYDEIMNWAKSKTNRDKTLIAANNGNSDAMVIMGQMSYYYHKNSIKESIPWYKKAAISGNANGQYKYGSLYSPSTGFEGEKDFSNKNLYVKWITKAANQGQSDAIWYVALKSEYGSDGFPKDLNKSIEYYKRSINNNKNLSLSFKGVAEVYEDLGDYDNAMVWRKNAITKFEVNSIEANRAIGDIADYYFEGQGVDKNYREALVWYKKVVDNSKKDSWLFAKTNMGLIYYNGGFGVDRDYQLALKYFRMADCANCPKPKFTKDGATAGTSESALMLGLMYEKGYGVTKDMEEAVRYYKRSANDFRRLVDSKGKQALKRLGLY